MLLREKQVKKLIKFRGFTLIELLVVVSIIGILAGFVVANFARPQAQTRNTERKNALKQLQTALQMYFNDYKAYPSTSSDWWGEPGCYNNGGSRIESYIPGLAPTYIKKLPHDPRVGQAYVGSPCTTCDTGYLYKSDGVDYKVLAHCSPEGTFSTSDSFYDPTRPTWAWTVYTSGAANW